MDIEVSAERVGGGPALSDLQVALAPRRSRRDGALAGLSGSPLVDRFRIWRGRSGRRYIFSVFPVGSEAAVTSLPELAEAVVVATSRQPDGSNQIVWIDQTDGYPDLLFRSRKIRDLRAEGATELHVHLLARSKDGRRAVVSDLS